MGTGSASYGWEKAGNPQENGQLKRKTRKTCNEKLFTSKEKLGRSCVKQPNSICAKAILSILPCIGMPPLPPLYELGGVLYGLGGGGL